MSCWSANSVAPLLSSVFSILPTLSFSLHFASVRSWNQFRMTVGTVFIDCRAHFVRCLGLFGSLRSCHSFQNPSDFFTHIGAWDVTSFGLRPHSTENPRLGFPSRSLLSWTSLRCRPLRTRSPGFHPSGNPPQWRHCEEWNDEAIQSASVACSDNIYYVKI